MNLKGMLILIVLFLLFYFVANYFLAKEIDKDKQEIDNSQVISPAYENEKKIVENLYSKVKILYDVVNNIFYGNANNLGTTQAIGGSGRASTWGRTAGSGAGGSGTVTTMQLKMSNFLCASFLQVLLYHSYYIAV